MFNSRTSLCKTSKLGFLPSFSIRYRYRSVISTLFANASMVIPAFSRAVLMICPSVSGLPHFRCQSLRHTFTTRMCEAGVNVKVIQDALGHKDISTTLNIYTDVTKELKRSEFEGLDLYFKNE